MSSTWTPEEERFINRLKRTPSQRQIAEITERCKTQLRQSLQSFIGRQNTPLNQRTIETITQQVVERHNQELLERGFTYQIQVSLKPLGDDDDIG